MKNKINFVVKTPSVENGLYIVFKVQEVNGVIESKEVFFSGAKDRVMQVLCGLFADLIEKQKGNEGRLIQFKSEVISSLPECFKRHDGHQEFMNFEV